MVTIPKDFREFIELLNAHEVDYVVVGGYAVAFHGAPRFTGDIDIFVAPTEANPDRIVAALVDFGFSRDDLHPEDFRKPDMVVQFGIPPLRIDVLTTIDGLLWDEIAPHVIVGRLDELSVRFIGLDELVRNKKASGRPKDIADVEALGGL